MSNSRSNTSEVGKNVVFSIKTACISKAIRLKLLYRPLIATHRPYTSFRLIPRLMTLNDIWSSFQPVLLFPRPMCRKLYTIPPQKLKLLLRNHTTAFRCCDCRWPWRYFKVIRLFHIKFLKYGAWYGKSYYRVITGNHTLAFDWCHFWWPWMIFEGHFSLGCHFHLRNSRRL